MSTIKDVARLAGVSTTTVSFVLNGTGSVGAEARGRVLKAAQELGYTANPLARAMITRKTRSLGVVVNNIDTFTASMMVNGIEEASRANGYEILLALHRNEPETAKAAVNDLAQRRVDALIAVFSRADRHPTAVEALDQCGIPFVIAYYRADSTSPADNIIVDQEQGGYLATRRLIEQGRRRITFVGGPEGRNANTLRLAGYVRALIEADLNPFRVSYGEFTVETGLQVGRELLEGTVPEGIVACDDNIAAGLLRAFRQGGKRVPEDIAVIGFNDSPWCEALDPPLTSVHLPLDEIGRLCVERAVERLNAPNEWTPQTILLPCEISVRESG